MAKFFGNVHDTERLAIALGMGHPKIAIHALLRVTRLLLTNDHDLFPMKPRHPTDDGRIIREGPISVDLAPIREDAFDVVERVRPLRVPGELRLFPRAQARVNLPAQCFYAL